MLPAHRTKHLPALPLPLPTINASLLLSQSADGRSNGTALWLGAQCLSFYLVASQKTHLSCDSARPKAIELGTGIGLTAYVRIPAYSLAAIHIPRPPPSSSLVLSSMGWDVLATDTRHVISSVLSHNISSNLSRLTAASGVVQVRELDWAVPPENWSWNDPATVATSSPTDASPSIPDSGDLLKPPFDLIVSSDTLYIPELISPLLRTLYSISSQSMTASRRPPAVYLCIERRDSAVIDRALHEATTCWGFDVQRIAHRKLIKSLEKGGIKWSQDEWSGIEIWRLKLRIQVSSRLTSDRDSKQPGQRTRSRLTPAVSTTRLASSNQVGQRRD